LKKLSIITINYNNINGLVKTINSVVEQTFSNFEFIVVDGGSEDGSCQKLIELSEKMTSWISEKDNGIYHAMNKGIIKATGEYLLFLNSGDFFIENNILEKVFSTKHTDDFLCAR